MTLTTSATTSKHAAGGARQVQRPTVNRQREHLFFLGMATAMLLVVLIGFARSFFFAFLWPTYAPDTSREPIYYIHGTFAATWLVLAVVQPFLIQAHRVRWHRLVGWIGAVIAVLAVLSGTLVAVLSAARGPDSTLAPTPLDFLAVIVSGIWLFGLFVALAIAYRRNGAIHKRLMYLATINLLQAAVVRIPVSFFYSAGAWTTFAIAYAFVIPLFLWDWRSLGRIQPSTLWGGVGLVGSLPVRMWLASTAASLTLARWAVSLAQ